MSARTWQRFLKLLARASSPKPWRRFRRSQLQVEKLEDRAMPSTLVYNAPLATSNSILLTRSGSNLAIYNNGQPQETVALSGVTAVEIHGSAGAVGVVNVHANNTLTVDETNGLIPVPVSFETTSAISNSNWLTVADGSDTSSAPVNVTSSAVAGAFGAITYSGVTLTSLTVNAAPANGPAVNVLSTSVPTYVTGGGGTITVGSFGSVKNLLAPLNVLGTTGAQNQLTVFASADAAQGNTTVLTSFTGPTPTGQSVAWGQIANLAPAPINFVYGTTASLTLFPSDGDRVNVVATGTVTNVIGQSIDQPTVVVGQFASLQNIAGALTVANAAKVTADDSADAGRRTVTVTAAAGTKVSGLAPAPITVSGTLASDRALDVRLGSGKDSVAVQSTQDNQWLTFDETAAGTTYTVALQNSDAVRGVLIHGNSAADPITLDAGDNGFALNDITQPNLLEFDQNHSFVVVDNTGSSLSYLNLPNGSAALHVLPDPGSAATSLTTLTLNGSGNVVATPNSSLPIAFPLSKLGSVAVTGQGRPDQLVLDFGGGSPLPAGGLSYDGGSGGGTLTLQNGTVGVEQDTATGLGSGSVTVDGAPITYANVTANILDTLNAQEFDFAGTSQSELLHVQGGPTVNNARTAEVASGGSLNSFFTTDYDENGNVIYSTPLYGDNAATFTAVDFTNKSTVTVNGGAGLDQIELDKFTPPAGLTSLVLDPGNVGTADSQYVHEDSVRILATVVPTTVTQANAGAGARPVDVTVSGPAGLADIAQPLVVRNTSSTDHLVIDTAGDTSNHSAVSVSTFLLGATYDRLTGLGNAGAISWVVNDGGRSEVTPVDINFRTQVTLGVSLTDAAASDTTVNLSTHVAGNQVTVTAAAHQNVAVDTTGGAATVTVTPRTAGGTISVDAGPDTTLTYDAAGGTVAARQVGFWIPATITPLPDGRYLYNFAYPLKENTGTISSPGLADVTYSGTPTFTCSQGQLDLDMHLYNLGPGNSVAVTAGGQGPDFALHIVSTPDETDVSPFTDFNGVTASFHHVRVHGDGTVENLTVQNSNMPALVLDPGWYSDSGFQVLAAASVTVDGGSSGTAVYAPNQGGNAVLTVNGTPIAFPNAYSTYRPATIIGNLGEVVWHAPAINVSNFASLTVQSTDSTMSLNPNQVQGAGVGNFPPLNFSGIPAITLDGSGAGGGNTIHLTETGLATAGLQNILVKANSSGATVTLDGTNFKPAVAGGSITVTGDDPFTNHLIVSGGDSPNTFTLNGSNLTAGSGSLDLTDVQNVTLNGGAGDDTFNVSNWIGSTKLDGGAGDDTYNVTLGGGGTVAVADSGGADQLNVTAGGGGEALNITATKTTLTGATDEIDYTAAVEALVFNGSAGADTFTVTPDAARAFTVHGNSDTLTLPLTPTLGAAGVVRTAAWQTSAPVGYAGSYTFSNRQPITFDGIAVLAENPTLTVTPGAAVGAGSGNPLTASASLQGSYLATGTLTFTLTGPDGTTVYTSPSYAVTGDGTYPLAASDSYTTNALGTYQWVAHYSGDSNNTSVSSTLGTAPETVVAASPTLTVTPGAAVDIHSGNPLTASASLQGSYLATGTLTFTLTGPDGTTVCTSPSYPVTGNGIYSLAANDSYTTNALGTYHWAVRYSGDSNNNSVTNYATEVVQKVTPSLAASASTSTVTLDSTTPVTATAALSGGYQEEGYVIFDLFRKGVKNTLLHEEQVTVTGDGLYTTPNGYLPGSAGNDFWSIDYLGDSNNKPVESNSLTLDVSKATPSVSTTAGGTVVLGSGAKLTATAVLADGGYPTGTLTFKLTSPTGATVDTESVQLSIDPNGYIIGNGTYVTPNGYLPTAAGTYQWQVSYQGDSNNLPAASTAAEIVSPATPILTWADPADITYGTALSATQLDATANVPGTFAYNAATDTVPGAGTHQLQVTFTPTDTTDYNSVTLSRTLTVDSATPWVNWATPTAITYGTSLSSMQQGASAAWRVDDSPVNVPGTFTYSPASGAILGAGTQTLQVTFTPTDATDFTAATASVQLNVSPAPLTITASAHSKLQGAADPSLSYTITSGTLVAGDQFSGVLTRTPGESVGSYPILQGTLSAGSNYALTFVGSVLFITDTDDPLTSAQSVPVSSTTDPVTAATTPSTPGAPQLTATASGFDGTLTVAQYASAPVPESSGTGAYFDANVASSDLPSAANPTVFAVFSNLAPAAPLFWWTGSTWAPVLDATGTPVVADPAGTATVPISPATSPTITQLGGTPFFAGTFTPALTANAGATVVLGTGSPLTASASLSSSANPGGTLTFTLAGPNGQVVDTETVAVSGNGTYTTPTGYLPHVAGTYQWTASYSGDSHNQSTSTVADATPEIAVGPGATVVGSALYLIGGNTNDLVTITPSGTDRTGSSGIHVTACLNGAILSNLSYGQSFSTIDVVGFGGNDLIAMDPTLAIATVISEGNGNDLLVLDNGNNTVTLGNGNNTVTLGNGNNTVTLGNGNDNVLLGNGDNVLVEGNGHDLVLAGNGNNLIVAGLGEHTILVGNGRNILIDGSVQLTHSDDSLGQVLADWVQGGTAAANVANLRARLNVTDNSSHANTLLAGGGLDWFWEHYSKDHSNRKPTDLLN